VAETYQLQFSTLTAVDRDSVKFVHGQFYGPVLIVKGGEPKFDSAGQPVKPYAEVLAQQIVDLQTTVRNLTAAAESEMAEYVRNLHNDLLLVTNGLAEI
jgi:hypothetical protein